MWDMDAIIGGSISDNKIKFYRRHTFKEDVKFYENPEVQFRLKDWNPFKEESAKDNTVYLTALYSESQEETPKEEQSLSRIASSDNSVPFDKKFIAQGNHLGEIIIWKLYEIQYFNQPAAIIRLEGKVMDIKFIQEDK